MKFKCLSSRYSDERADDVLFTRKGWVCVRSIHEHSFVRDVCGLCDSICPEGRGLDTEVFDKSSLSLPDSERDRSTIAVCTCMFGEVVPPLLREDGYAWSEKLQERTYIRFTCPFPWIPPLPCPSISKSEPVTTHHEA